MIYVLILIVIIVLVFAFQKWETSQVDSKMKVFSGKAIVDAKESHDINLDLSKDSLEQVNLIIQKKHSKHDKNRAKLSLIYGAYIGEVIISLADSAGWIQASPVWKKRVYAIKISEDNYALPIEWVSNHLTNGEDDNILYKFISWRHAHNV